MKKTLKSAICIALAAALLLAAALFVFAGTGTSENELKLLVASDIHYRPFSVLPPLSETNGLPGDPLFYHVNTKGMLTYEADAVIDAFFRQAERSGAKFLLIPGDLSEEGHWAEHLGIAAKLTEFKANTGIQVFVTPGNHDIRTSASQNRLNLEDFVEIYDDFGFNEALTRHDGSASYTAELDAGYRLLAIDTCVYRDDKSFLSDELFDWVKEQALTARRDGKKLIAMTHYNVLEHFGIEGLAADMLCAHRYRELSTALADLGVKYVFTGHGHANDISHAVTKQGNKIFDIETGSLITYPNAWREVVFSDASVKIETKYVEEIDTGLLPPGFSDAQIALMNSDFQKYSFDYHRAGFRSYAYMIPDLTKTLADALNVTADSAGYAAIEAAVGALADAVKLPLYGETNSVGAVAKKAGVTLSPSEYVNLLDLAGTIYAGHYAGNENYPMDSLEVRLLGQAINAILVTALTDTPVKAANALFAAMGMEYLAFPEPEILLTLAAKRIYARTAAKVITNELVNTLAQGIFTDWSAPDDLNAVLEPYGESWALDGAATKITDFTFILDLVTRVFRMVLDIVWKIGTFSFLK
ncbi:MAG: metallophosphoesterase [Oscillospiraceae bacterium]|nr:metallophosphoesterase [Oscillospiraceae bacterium]